MRESREYIAYFRRNGWIIGMGLVVGVVVGVMVVMGGGKVSRVGQSLELTANESQIVSRSMLADSAVIWVRQVAKEREWIGKEELVVYKQAPVIVRVEVIGVDGSDKALNRVVDEMVAKYGFGRLTAVERSTSNKFSLWMVIVSGGIGGMVGLIISLIRSYWRNF